MAPLARSYYLFNRYWLIPSWVISFSVFVYIYSPVYQLVDSGQGGWIVLGALALYPLCAPAFIIPAVHIARLRGHKRLKLLSSFLMLAAWLLLPYSVWWGDKSHWKPTAWIEGAAELMMIYAIWPWLWSFKIWLQRQESVA